MHNFHSKMKFTAAISAILLASTVDASSIRRRLSYERIAGYEPKSQVTDHNAIDLDQEVRHTVCTMQNFFLLVRFLPSHIPPLDLSFATPTDRPLKLNLPLPPPSPSTPP